MHILVRYPCLVEHYAPHFASLFSPEGYRYFRRFLSGLLVSENKTLEAINRLFVLEPRNQSSFNRFVNRQSFDLAALNRRRVGLMQQSEETRFKGAADGGGVLALDDSLMQHYGRAFRAHLLAVRPCAEALHLCPQPGFGALQRRQDRLSSFQPLMAAPRLGGGRRQDAPTGHPCQPKQMGQTLGGAALGGASTSTTASRTTSSGNRRCWKCTKPNSTSVWMSQRRFAKEHPGLDLPLAMDSGYTSADMCRILDEELQMSYVGTLVDYQQVELSGSELLTLADFKRRLLREHAEGKCRFFKTTVPYKGQKETYYADLRYPQNQRFFKKTTASHLV